MSGRFYEQSRHSFADWLAALDTRMTEANYALGAVINALMAVTIYKGQSVAPFAEMPLWKGEVWTEFFVFTLALGGCVGLFVLLFGTWRKTYLVRAFVAACGALMWAAIVASILASDAPHILALFYTRAVVFTALSALALYVQHDEARERSAIDHAPTSN